MIPIHEKPSSIAGRRRWATPKRQFFYGLHTDDDPTIRYIGRTQDPESREKSHRSNCRNLYFSVRGFWLALAAAKGYTVHLRVLGETIEPVLEFYGSRIEADLIRQWHGMGTRLLNSASFHTDGYRVSIPNDVKEAWHDAIRGIFQGPDTEKSWHDYDTIVAEHAPLDLLNSKRSSALILPRRQLPRFAPMAIGIADPFWSNTTGRAKFDVFSAIRRSLLNATWRIRTILFLDLKPLRVRDRTLPVWCGFCRLHSTLIEVVALLGTLPTRRHTRPLNPTSLRPTRRQSSSHATSVGSAVGRFASPPGRRIPRMTSSTLTVPSHPSPARPLPSPDDPAGNTYPTEDALALAINEAAAGDVVINSRLPGRNWVPCTIIPDSDNALAGIDVPAGCPPEAIREAVIRKLWAIRDRAEELAEIVAHV